MLETIMERTVSARLPSGLIAQCFADIVNCHLGSDRFRIAESILEEPFLALAEHYRESGLEVVGFEEYIPTGRKYTEYRVILSHSPNVFPESVA